MSQQIKIQQEQLTLICQSWERLSIHDYESIFRSKCFTSFTINLNGDNLINSNKICAILQQLYQLSFLQILNLKFGYNNKIYGQIWKKLLYSISQLQQLKQISLVFDTSTLELSDFKEEDRIEASLFSKNIPQLNSLEISINKCSITDNEVNIIGLILLYQTNLSSLKFNLNDNNLGELGYSFLMNNIKRMNSLKEFCFSLKNNESDINYLEDIWEQLISLQSLISFSIEIEGCQMNENFKSLQETNYNKQQSIKNYSFSLKDLSKNNFNQLLLFHQQSFINLEKLSITIGKDNNIGENVLTLQNLWSQQKQLKQINICIDKNNQIEISHFEQFLIGIQKQFIEQTNKVYLIIEQEQIELGYFSCDDSLDTEEPGCQEIQLLSFKLLIEDKNQSDFTRIVIDSLNVLTNLKSLVLRIRGRLEIKTIQMNIPLEKMDLQFGFNEQNLISVTKLLTSIRKDSLKVLKIIAQYSNRVENYQLCSSFFEAVAHFKSIKKAFLIFDEQIKLSCLSISHITQMINKENPQIELKATTYEVNREAICSSLYDLFEGIQNTSHLTVIIDENLNQVILKSSKIKSQISITIQFENLQFFNCKIIYEGISYGLMCLCKLKYFEMKLIQTHNILTFRDSVEDQSSEFVTPQLTFDLEVFSQRYDDMINQDKEKEQHQILLSKTISSLYKLKSLEIILLNNNTYSYNYCILKDFQTSSLKLNYLKKLKIETQTKIFFENLFLIISLMQNIQELEIKCGIQQKVKENNNLIQHALQLLQLEKLSFNFTEWDYENRKINKKKKQQELNQLSRLKCGNSKLKYLQYTHIFSKSEKMFDFSQIKRLLKKLIIIKY